MNDERKDQKRDEDEATDARAKRTGREGVSPNSMPAEYINEQPNRTEEPPPPGKSRGE